MTRTDINKVAETLLIPLFSEVYGYTHLQNLNYTEGSNYPGIDLGDETARVAFQITSTSNSEKIKKTLRKFVEYKLYEKYDSLIIYILTEKQQSYSGKGYLEGWTDNCKPLHLERLSKSAIALLMTYADI